MFIAEVFENCSEKSNKAWIVYLIYWGRTSETFATVKNKNYTYFGGFFVGNYHENY